MNSSFSEHDEHTVISGDADSRQTGDDDTQITAPDAVGSEASVDATPPAARKKRAPRASSGGARRRPRTRETGIIELRVPARSDATAQTRQETATTQSDDDRARVELEAQGFTTDEAARIVDLSLRLSSSREARDAEASMRRLRFTRWLVERGVLDEFSA